MNNQSEKTTVTIEMFKISGGIKIVSYDLTAMSNSHAVTVCEDFYNRLGLLGRYYCETSEGYNFQVTN